MEPPARDAPARHAPARHALDPELAAGLERFAAGGAGGPPPAPGDWRALRRLLTADMARLAAAESVPRPNVATVDFEAAVDDGQSLALRWYHPRGTQPGSAVVPSTAAA
jgi:hypothetical protein